MMVPATQAWEAHPYTPKSNDENWDVVVVGTGMGGATLGHALASRGRRVLFVEKGLFLQYGATKGDGSFTGESTDPEDRLREARWPFKLEGDTSFGKMEFFAPLGCGTGGSTNLYAAQLERMLPCDFEPRRHHQTARDSTLPEAWPISYAELLPYYRRAERLYDVHGTEDPLNPDPYGTYAAPPPLSERDQSLFESFQALGLNPYRAHVACSFKPGCGGCGSSMCPRECKRDAGSTCLLPALRDHGARLLTESEVVRLEANSDRVDTVVARRAGQEIRVKGKVVVLAAGALMTPALLLRSTSPAWPNGLANRSGLVGRNLMMHTSDFVAIRPKHNLSPVGPHKGISLNDLYLKDGAKMGNLQSAGMKVNVGLIAYYLKTRAEREGIWYLQVGRAGRKAAAHIGHTLYRSANIFATVVEDLPYFDNRIVLDMQAKNGMKFVYRYPDELKARNQRFQDELKRALSPQLKVLPIKAGSNNLNFGHCAGTCRAGTDPQASVVDRDNRAHDLENLYIADASAFPSSGGINPSLTIAARALQVADAIDRSLPGERVLQAARATTQLPTG